MTSRYAQLTRIARRLRQAPERFAAAAAVYDPSLLARTRYAAFWHAPVSLTLGPGPSAPSRTWIDEGVMTVFFMVVGLEAKRERDLGELRDRRRLTVPVLATAGAR